MNKDYEKDYGFGSELDNIDASEWTPETPTNDQAPVKKPKAEQVKKVAEKAGFTSREPVPAKENVITIRAKQSAIDEFRDLAKSQEPKWPQGYTFERALAALKRELTQVG